MEIVALTNYLGFVAAPLLPCLIVKAIRKIHDGNMDYVPELAGMAVCALILWTRVVFGPF